MDFKQAFIALTSFFPCRQYLVWLLVLSTCSSMELRAQSASVTDSLRQVLDLAQSDSARRALTIELSFVSSGKDPLQSATYARQVLKDSGFCTPPQLINTWRYLAFSYLDRNLYDSALWGFNRALSIAFQHRDTVVWLNTAALVSDCHYLLGDITAAFHIAFKALPIADATHNYRQIGELNNRIGELYRGQNETEKAIQYLQQSYEGFARAGIPGGMLAAKANLALAYKQSDPEKALFTYEEILREFNTIFSPEDSAHIYSNLANINLGLKRYDKAEANLMQALKCHQRMDKPVSLAYCHKELAELYLHTNKPQEALKYALMAMNIAQNFDHYELKYQCSRQLAEAYSLLENYREAYRYLKDYKVLQDSMLNKEKLELSHELEAKYSTEKKEQQIKLQEARIRQEFILRNALIVGLLLLLLIGGLVYRNARLQMRKNREIQQFASKLQELQSTQSRWFANIAHELRTPLTLILGPIQHLLRRSETDSTIRTEVVLAKKYGDQLLHRVNEILEISKLDSGKLVLEQHPTELVTLLKQVVASFQSFASEKEVKLYLKTDFDVLALNIDPNKITTIVNNLVANALKFTPANKEVTIGLQRDHSDGDLVRINVTDQGIGISAEDLPHVFERFYQSSAPGHKAYGGSGVGLTLSQELAKLHGGLISVFSQAGQGSVFVLSLPATLICKEDMLNPIETEEAEADIAQTWPPNPINTEVERPRVLLVEDHVDMRKYICRILSPRYEIAEAANGVEALDKLEIFHPDLIISDVKMPDMDGLTFAKKVRADEKYRLTPFVSLTAHANEKDKLTALKTGVDDYLIKPFDAEELLARVHNLIANASERKKALAEIVGLGEPARDLTYDEKVMSDLEQLVKEHLEDSNFSVTELAQLSALSVSSLTRQVKKMTGLAPGQFIRDIRLQKAIELLESRQYATIKEVVYAVGFEDVSSFSRLFKSRFGKSPSEYLSRGAYPINT